MYFTVETIFPHREINPLKEVCRKILCWWDKYIYHAKNVLHIICTSSTCGKNCVIFFCLSIYVCQSSFYLFQCLNYNHNTFIIRSLCCSSHSSWYVLLLFADADSDDSYSNKKLMSLLRDVKRWVIILLNTLLCVN